MVQEGAEQLSASKELYVTLGDCSAVLHCNHLVSIAHNLNNGPMSDLLSHSGWEYALHQIPLLLARLDSSPRKALAEAAPWSTAT